MNSGKSAVVVLVIILGISFLPLVLILSSKVVTWVGLGEEDYVAIFAVTGLLYGALVAIVRKFLDHGEKGSEKQERTKWGQ